MDLSIIIINYDTHEHLKNCLDSIINNVTDHIKYEILVIDNNSPDRGIEELPLIFPTVNFLFQKTNKGFGHACNFGVSKSTGEFILFLNPDIEITKCSIETLYNFLKQSNDAGIVSGSLNDRDGKILYSFNKFPGILWELKEAYGIGIEPAINNLNNITDEHIKNKKPFEVDWFHGACMMMRRDLFVRTRGFDEHFFLYYEDVDLCQKVKKMNLKNVCIPWSRFYHFERSSVRNNNGNFVYYYNMHTSKIYYMKKYFGKLSRGLVRFMFISGTVLKIIFYPVKIKIKKVKGKNMADYIIMLKVYLGINSKNNYEIR